MKISIQAALLTGSLGVACGGAGSAQAAPAALATPAALVVSIKDFKFAPTPLRVHVGDTVAFVNDDAEAHTVTSSDKTFDSEGLDSNGTWKHTFSKAGTFTYFCELHPYMKGTIVVLPAEKAP